MIKRKKANDEITMEQEMSALNDCFEALNRLNNYKAEMRIVRYLMERLKGDSKRKYGDDD